MLQYYSLNTYSGIKLSIKIMQISFIKEKNLVLFETKKSKVGFPLERTSLEEAKKLIGEVDLLILVPEEYSVLDEEIRDSWISFQKEARAKGTLVCYTPGGISRRGFQVQALDDGGNLNFIATHKNMQIGLFLTKPSKEFCKKRAPLDILVGKSDALVGTHLDFEPFYVLLTEVSDSYRSNSGISEIDEKSKVKIERIKQSDRENAVDLKVIKLG